MSCASAVEYGPLEVRQYARKSAAIPHFITASERRSRRRKQL
jgi:hypothetical protein